MTKPLIAIQKFNDFKQWVNKHPLLESYVAQLTTGDIDNIFFHDSGNTCHILFVETKECGEDNLEDSQKNIYAIIDAVFRRYSTQNHHPIAMKLWGRIQSRKINYLGTHLLVFENTNPDNSTWMKWDNDFISIPELINLLRFNKEA